MVPPRGSQRHAAHQLLMISMRHGLVARNPGTKLAEELLPCSSGPNSQPGLEDFSGTFERYFACY